MKTFAIAFAVLVAIAAPSFAKPTKAQSDLKQKYNQTFDGIAQNIRG